MENADRSLYLDNIKWLMVLLVIWGHISGDIPCILKIPANVKWLIYRTHIPTLALVSGMLTSKSKKPFDLFKQDALPFLLLYFIWQAVNILFTESVMYTSSRGLLCASNYMWYLLALFAWRSIIVISKKSPIKLSPVGILFITLVVGATFRWYIYTTESREILAFGRTTYNLPFFVAGYLLKDKILELSSKKSPLWEIWGVLVIGLMTAISFFDPGFCISLDRTLLRRLIVFYPLNFLMIASIFAIMPSKEIKIFGFNTTKNWGKYTLHAYILHGFGISIIRILHLSTWFQLDIYLTKGLNMLYSFITGEAIDIGSAQYWLVLSRPVIIPMGFSLIIAVVLMSLCSSKTAGKIFHKLFYPKWMLR